MALTAAQANAQLASITTADQLRALIAQLDTSASGSTTVLYSGGLTAARLPDNHVVVDMGRLPQAHAVM